MLLNLLYQAYETLGDERKRQDYDRFGATPVGGGDSGGEGGPGHGMSFAHAEDIFRAFFGGRVRACESMCECMHARVWGEGGRLVGIFGSV